MRKLLLLIIIILPFIGCDKEETDPLEPFVGVWIKRISKSDYSMYTIFKNGEYKKKLYFEHYSLDGVQSTEYNESGWVTVSYDIDEFNEKEEKYKANCALVFQMKEYDGIESDMKYTRHILKESDQRLVMYMESEVSPTWQDLYQKQ